MSKGISSDTAWKNIFLKLDILKQVNKGGYFDITADQIKEHGYHKEPRLMTKIDFREHLPRIMAENGFSILAITNGSYRIAKTNPFIDIIEAIPQKIKKISFPENFLSLNPESISSEFNALDMAYISGILNEVFQEKTALTIRGRMRAGLPFEFKLNDVNYKINGVQIEVDGGYEGKSSVNLIEAKIGSRSNINIRQLLYPELYWKNRIGGKKNIRTFIFYYQEPYFRFIPFIMEEDRFYADQNHELAFIFAEEKEKFELYAIEARESNDLVNLKAPFPQADKFDKVLAMLTAIDNQEPISKKELNLDFDIVDRQIDYYYNTLKFMGLTDSDGENIWLTNKGKEIVKLPHSLKLQEMAKIIFSEPIFNIALKKGVGAINAKFFKRWRVGLDSSTIPRRKLTVKSWVDFFVKMLS